MKWKTLISEIISFLFILLWVYASVSKLLDYQTFKIQLSQSPLAFPVAPFTAWFIPLIELLLAFGLILPRTRLYALFGSFSLMILFTFYIWFITEFSDNIPCSCGGILQDMNWNQHMLFNILFVIASLTAVLVYPKNISLQQIRPTRKPVIE